MRNISWRRPAVAALAVPALLLAGCARRPEVEPATLVLHKGRIATVDDAKPEAQALAADTVVVGTDEEIAPFIGPQTRVIDPGPPGHPRLHRAHGHFTG